MPIKIFYQREKKVMYATHDRLISNLHDIVIEATN